MRLPLPPVSALAIVGSCFLVSCTVAPRLDPGAAAARICAAVRPGMTMAEVLRVAGEPTRRTTSLSNFDVQAAERIERRTSDRVWTYWVYPDAVVVFDTSRRVTRTSRAACGD